MRAFLFPNYFLCYILYAYTHIHIHIYICIYTYTHIYIYIYIYICMHVYVYTYIYLSLTITYSRESVRACVRTCVRAYSQKVNKSKLLLIKPRTEAHTEAGKLNIFWLNKIFSFIHVLYLIWIHVWSLIF